MPASAKVFEPSSKTFFGKVVERETFVAVTFPLCFLTKLIKS